MKILVVGKVKTDQVDRLAEEADKLGHELVNCGSKDLYIEASNEKFEVGIKDHDLTSFDLIYLLVVGKRRWEWATACHYLNKEHGTKIVNHKMIDPTYNYFLTSAIDYLKQMESGIKFPQSAIVFSGKEAEAVSTDFTFPVIMKVSGGKQGNGVFKLASKEELVAKVEELKAEVPSSFVIRELIPNDGDIRVFTVGYKVIGAMKRTPKEGDFRSNISQGGSGDPFPIEDYPKYKEIAEKLSEIMKTEIAGVDIMVHKETGEPYVLEINPGPQFEGLEKYAKVNAAGEIIKYFVSLVGEK